MKSPGALRRLREDACIEKGNIKIVDTKHVRCGMSEKIVGITGILLNDTNDEYFFEVVPTSKAIEYGYEGRSFILVPGEIEIPLDGIMQHLTCNLELMSQFFKFLVHQRVTIKSE